MNTAAIRSAALAYLHALLVNAYRWRTPVESTSGLRARVTSESRDAMAMARAFGVHP